MAFDKLFAGKAASAATQDAGAGEASSGAPEFNSPDPRRDSRRTRRVYIAMPVVVEGQKGKDAFEEKCVTEAVNAHGCLVRLSARLERGQKVTLTNSKSGEKAECSVVYLGQGGTGGAQAGLEFTNPSEYFWHIAFPPDDWNPAERKKPVSPKNLPRASR